VEVLLERAEHLAERVRRWWHVRGVAGATPADPVQAATHLAGKLLGATHAAHQSGVGLVQESHRQGQAPRIRELRTRVGERVEVVAHLLDVGAGRSPRLGTVLGLEREQVDEGRLRALDLRRDHGLLAHERVEEPVERRHHLPGQLEANQGLLSGTEAGGDGGVDDERRRRRRRQGVREGGRDLLPAHGGPLVSSGGSLRHRPGRGGTPA
jgi:hypothetical protein